MGGRGMAAHRPGARGRTPTQAQRKRELGPNHQVFSDAEKLGFKHSTVQHGNIFTFHHFEKGDKRVTMIENGGSRRIREAQVSRRHANGAHEVIDEVRVGSGNRRDRVRALLKKHGG